MRARLVVESTCGDAGGAVPLVGTFDVRLLSISDSSISSGAVQADPFFFPFSSFFFQARGANANIYATAPCPRAWDVGTLKIPSKKKLREEAYVNDNCVLRGPAVRRITDRAPHVWDALNEVAGAQPTV